MTSKKPTEWGGGADAQLAPFMRLIDFVLIYAALWLPIYARGGVWDQRSWAAATIEGGVGWSGSPTVKL